MNADAVIRLLGSKHNYEAAGRALHATSTATPTTSTHTAHLVEDTTNNELWHWNGSTYENISLMTFTQQPNIVDADGTLADLTTKFNTALSQLETLGLFASS